MALDTNGNATASLLYRPYGTPRYSSGGMRTPFGFTGQREDTSPAGSSGLDYFNARYYDAETGRFTSADDAQPGLGDPSGMDDYAYVAGMVEQATDPSGHMMDMTARWVDMVGQAGSVDGAGGAVAGVLLVLLNALLPAPNQIGVGTLAGTVPAGTTVTQENSTITLAPGGAITVTTSVGQYGSTSTVYAPGQPGYGNYIHAFDVPVSAGDLSLNRTTDHLAATSTAGSSAIATLSNPSASNANAGVATSTAPVGAPPSTVQPGDPGATMSALATTVATAGSLAGIWYAFAKNSKEGSNTAANKRAQQVAKEFCCDPDSDPECYEDFMDALHNFKGKSGRGGADHWPIERLRAFAREYFEGDPPAWQIYDP